MDTAGRQVIDDRLMGELKNIKATVRPDEILLVVDAMTGQEAATVTARFNEDVGITGKWSYDATIIMGPHMVQPYPDVMTGCDRCYPDQVGW